MLEIPDVVEFERVVPNSLKPPIENEDEKKKAFGIELGKGKNAFEAACIVCGDNTNIALYISQRWLNDPVVIASKDLYLKAVHNPDDLLDADQLSAKLLKMVEEKDRTNNFYMLDGKQRLDALALYAKIRKFTDTSAPTGNNFTFNKMVVKFVAPEKKEEKVINQLPNEEKLLNPKLAPLKLKLVASS